MIVSWMAVTQYLSGEAVSKTLRQVTNFAGGSRIVFTYDVPRHALDGRDQPAFDRVTSFAAEAGEPFVSLFEPGEIDGLLIDQGFVDVTHLRRDDLWLRYPGLGPAAELGAGVQRVVVATRG